MWERLRSGACARRSPCVRRPSNVCAHPARPSRPKPPYETLMIRESRYSTLLTYASPPPSRSIQRGGGPVAPVGQLAGPAAPAASSLAPLTRRAGGETTCEEKRQHEVAKKLRAHR